MKYISNEQMSTVEAGTTRRQAFCGSTLLAAAGVGLALSGGAGIIILGAWAIVCM